MYRGKNSEDDVGRSRLAHGAAITCPVLAACLAVSLFVAFDRAGRSLFDDPLGMIVVWAHGIVGTAASAVAIAVLRPPGRRWWAVVLAYLLASPLIYLAACVGAGLIAALTVGL